MKTRFFKVLFFVVLLSINSLAFARSLRVYDFKTLATNIGFPLVKPDELQFDSKISFFNSSEAEIEDLVTYSSKEDTYYKEINGYLRYYPNEYEWSGISPKDAKGIVKNIDSIFKRVPSLPEDIILFRGVDLGYRKGKSLDVGDEFVEKGYVSTSTNLEIAKYFAGGINDDSEFRKAIFVLYLNKKNEKGILFDQGEDEVLLKHGERIRVMDTDKKNKQYDIYLAQICDIKCDSNLDNDAKEFWSNFLEKQTN